MKDLARRRKAEPLTGPYLALGDAPLLLLPAEAAKFWDDREKIRILAAKAYDAACDRGASALFVILNGPDGAEAARMAAAARGKQNMVWFNYRRVPAIAFARQLVDEGRIGRVYHFRATYLQDWTLDPSVPLVWRMDKEVAGSGVTGDLHSHIVDLSNYLAGEITSVAGTSRIFVNERERPEGGTSPIEIEDASIFVARYADGAIGHFEATRFANGRKNGNTFELNGDQGSVYFNLEDMSRLWYFDSRDPKHVQGWRQISVWEECHPYMDKWWVPGCAIGYEHTFANQAADLLEAIAEGRPMNPDFDDGLKCQLVLDAVLEACASNRWVDVKRAAEASA
jgi:predicted dehydrogenase